MLLHEAQVIVSELYFYRLFSEIVCIASGDRWIFSASYEVFRLTHCKERESPLENLNIQVVSPPSAYRNNFKGDFSPNSEEKSHPKTEVFNPDSFKFISMRFIPCIKKLKGFSRNLRNIDVRNDMQSVLRLIEIYICNYEEKYSAVKPGAKRNSRILFRNKQHP